MLCQTMVMITVIELLKTDPNTVDAIEVYLACGEIFNSGLLSEDDFKRIHNYYESRVLPALHKQYPQKV
jgi:hypothetical protein